MARKIVGGGAPRAFSAATPTAAGGGGGGGGGGDARRSPPGRVERALKADISRLFLRDQVLFSLGVVNALAATAWLFAAPRSFPRAFVCALPPVLAWLVYSFGVRRFWVFFLADYCYAANIAAWLFFVRAEVRGALAGAGGGGGPAGGAPPPAGDAAFALAFALVTGPLLCANVPWRISLVPHSPDKMCSVFIHVSAPLAAFAYRWHGGGAAGGAAPVATARALLLAPAAFYAAWQVAYLLLTELLCARALARDPRFATSLRHLTASASAGALRAGGAPSAALRCARALRAVPPHGVFDARAARTKIFFVAAQAAYTAASLGVAAAAFWSRAANAALLAAVVLAIVFNGAGYYVRVFSDRYRVEAEGKVRECAATATQSAR